MVDIGELLPPVLESFSDVLDGFAEACFLFGIFRRVPLSKRKRALESLQVP